MHIVHTIADLRQQVSKARREGRRIGFVPTMGALHEGHGALIRASVEAGNMTVVSIFVNPLQFGEGEDFESYPRVMDADEAYCRELGVDLVFAPSDREVYPEGQPKTFVDVVDLTDGLCGRSRPGHFRGVTTVVCKLFNMVGPDLAYFGQKDFQQLAVIRRMVDDLNMPVEIVPVATVREKDGLAMSSRNKYLNVEERQSASVIFRALSKAGQLLESGERDPGKLRQAVMDVLQTEPSVQMDYVEVVDARSLSPLSYIGAGADGVKDEILIAVAVFIGKTRLIDNLYFKIGA